MVSTSTTWTTPRSRARPIARADFVVALELRESEVTRAADVVFPVAPVTDRSGTFVNWEGRVRQFGKVLHNPSSLPDLRVLAGIAEEMGAPSASAPPSRCGRRWSRSGPWDGERPLSMRVVSTGSTERWASTARPTGELVLASWKQLIDDGRMQDGDDAMRATARKPVVLVGPATLEALGATVGETGSR